jgi:hypothetical protein
MWTWRWFTWALFSFPGTSSPKSMMTLHPAHCGLGPGNVGIVRAINTKHIQGPASPSPRHPRTLSHTHVAAWLPAQKFPSVKFRCETASVARCGESHLSAGKVCREAQVMQGSIMLTLSIPRVRGQRIQYVFGQNRLRTLCFNWWYIFLRFLIHYMFRHHFNSAIIRCYKIKKFITQN